MSDPAAGGFKPSGRRKFDEAWKLITVGDKNVGKTCLIKRYSANDFSDEGNLATIGTEMIIHFKELLNKQLKITQVDTAGQELFGAVT